MCDARRLRRPEVLAHLCGNDEFGEGVACEKLVGTKGRIAARRPLKRIDFVGARRKVARFVEFVVIWNIYFGHDAENLAGVEGNCTIVELAAHAQRRTNENEGVDFAG